MKAKELMIGDKVMVKVLSQIPDTYVLHTWTVNDYSRDIQVKPITLTAEILEKNGFEMFKYDGWVHYYRIFGIGAIPFVLHSTIGGEMLSQEVDIFSTSTNTNCGIDVNYVHELQHALRLCGLNKIADNFKL